MGRSYGDVCLNPDGVLWNATGLDRFIHFDEDTGKLVCEAGVLLGEIQRLFIPRGWILPVTTQCGRCWAKSPVQQPNLPSCKGNLETVDLIDGDTRFVRVKGWIFNPIGRTYPQVVRFINSQSKVVGYAVIGKPRPDVANAIDKKALPSDYKGYLLSDQVGSTMTLQAENQAGSSCQMQVNVPASLLSNTTKIP